MLLSDSDWQAVQRRATLPAFQPAMQRLHDEVADFLAQPVTVPAEPGGYYHDFFCPEHGVQLIFDPTSPLAHRCPVDNAIWRGERFDAAWRWFVNNRLAESMLRLAVLWRLEGKAEHLAWIVQTLTSYADQYANYQKVVRTVDNPGVATYTTLDESVWVLPLTWAFDLVRDQLSPQADEHIAHQLLLPVAAHLVKEHFRGIHNFACWHNAAIGTIGAVLERTDLLDFAIRGEFGFDTQLREGVLADGLWFEGSFSYHFYTLAAVIALVKVTRHLPNLDLRQRPEVSAMFLAPIQAAYPDWSMPATNDCWYFTSLLHDCCHGVPPAPAFYEVAAALYAEPLFAEVLQRAYQVGQRDSLDALLFGREALPSSNLTQLPSINLPASGYAILRDLPPDAVEADREQRYLLLKYGPHGAGHGHPDKLNLILYAYGQRLSPDLGTPGYGLDLFESWYRQTICHNTVTLDGRSQPEATGQGRAFQSTGPIQMADAIVTWQEQAGAYQNVTMRRIILTQPTYFLDVFLVESSQPRRIDWIYHNAGRASTVLPLSPYSAIQEEGEGYPHLSQVQSATTDEDFTVDWQAGGIGLRLFVAGTEATTVLTGLAPSYPPNELAATLLNRRQTAATAYLALFHPYQETPQVHAVEWHGRDLLHDGWAGCRVQLADRSDQWLIRLTPDVTIPAWFTEQPADRSFMVTLTPP
ncbi:MAG: heparinase II/III-family protein [Chloroflexi bacterium]|nr:heparinase II/III-family protein [Chloroflexota bacterium]